MLVFALFVAAAAIWQSADAKICQRGFIKHGRSCYWFSPKSLIGSWIEAKEYCENMNSYLVIITSAQEDNFIRGLLKRRAKRSSYWIGANDIQVEGVFFWMTKGEPKRLTYTHWATSQPSNYGDGENCASMWRKVGFWWNDAPCYSQMGFICEQN